MVRLSAQINVMATPAADIVHAALRAAGLTAPILGLHEATGGSIAHALTVETSAGFRFIKIGDRRQIDAFTAEAEGLQALSRCSAVRVPRVDAYGEAENTAYLLLEHIDLHPLTESHAAAAGRALAALHDIAGEEFGWHRDNYLGHTPQSNRPHSDWCSFFTAERLRPQLALARAHRASATLLDRGERLANTLPALLAPHTPRPSLLHGDLWHGNAALDAHGTLVLFDPAVYFGDRETDLAMAELFGGFPPAFHAAYQAAQPLPPGSAQRRLLYQLYHVLNHFNLFGASYANKAAHLIDRLLDEIHGC